MRNKIKKTAEQAVKEAGDILLSRFSKFNRAEVELKSQHEILTKADLASEKKILEIIKKNFPSHRILSEEKGDNKANSDYLWVLDPLDGTTNFSMHNPLWSISLAVVYQNEVILGLVHAPFLGETFVARKGQGVYMLKANKKKKIKVSSIDKGKVINAFCHGHKKSDIQKALKYHRYQKLHNFDCRQLGSAAIELAYVACGRIESIVIPGANPWDVAAGALLVREASGKVTDFNNKKWNLNSPDILASNNKVHSQVLKALK